MAARYFIPGVPDVSEDELGDYFGKYGEVVRISVSRGSAYLTMSGTDSRDAIVTDRHEIGGKMLRVLISKECLQSAEAKKVHLGKLAEHITADSIRDAFSQFGTVLDVHTPKDAYTGQRKNYGFVTFGSDEAFDAALESGSIDIDGNTVLIKPANQTLGESNDYTEPSAPPPEPAAGKRARRESGIKYFVPGLPEEAKDEDLLAAFEKYGTVLDAAVVIDKDTEASRGFGYVTMEDISSQEGILTTSHMIAGKAIQALLTKDSLAGFNVKKIHLGRVDHDITAEAIRESFSDFGLVVDVHTPKDVRTGERKDFAFVTFATDDAFRKAVRAKRHDVGNCTIEIKPAAQSRGDPDEEASYGGGPRGKGGFRGGEWGPSPGKGSCGKGFNPYEKGFGKGCAPWDWGCKGFGNWDGGPWDMGFGGCKGDPWGGWGKGWDDPWSYGKGCGWDAGKGYGDAGKGYGKGYGDCGKGYSAPGKGYGDAGKGYGKDCGKGYGDAGKGYGDAGRGYGGDGGKSYGTGYGDAGKGCGGDGGKGYGDAGKGYGDAGKGYGGDGGKSYGKGYGDAGKGYGGDGGKGYGDAGRSYGGDGGKVYGGRPGNGKSCGHASGGYERRGYEQQGYERGARGRGEGPY